MVIDAKDAITGGLHLEPPIAKRIVPLNSKVGIYSGRLRRDEQYHLSCHSLPRSIRLNRARDIDYWGRHFRLIETGLARLTGLASKVLNQSEIPMFANC